MASLCDIPAVQNELGRSRKNAKFVEGMVLDVMARESSERRKKQERRTEQGPQTERRAKRKRKFGHTERPQKPACTKRPQEATCAERSRQEATMGWPFASRRERDHRDNQSCQHFDLGLPASRIVCAERSGPCCSKTEAQVWTLHTHPHSPTDLSIDLCCEQRPFRGDADLHDPRREMPWHFPPTQWNGRLEADLILFNENTLCDPSCTYICEIRFLFHV
ncbi:unnamed protein product [Rangifer tarandus platyrhynchus]|uniref:Uncharacterized protein n=2 Tax=Rangifer tarandus platyrhynchus TaxID=3082113 RepID=A0AC59Z8J3_RANTA|nr:unnamed protein product [Rangifer tarandus platyrhynchus]